MAPRKAAAAIKAASQPRTRTERVRVAKSLPAQVFPKWKITVTRKSTDTFVQHFDTFVDAMKHVEFHMLHDNGTSVLIQKEVNDTLQ